MPVMFAGSMSDEECVCYVCGMICCVIVYWIMNR